MDFKNHYQPSRGTEDMPLLERPKIRIENLNGKELADDLRNFAARHGIDLSMADIEETKKILRQLPSSLSDEIEEMREGSD